MMSSWRSGRLTSCTALSAHGATAAATARPAIATAARKPSRRRSARAREGRRGRGVAGRDLRVAVLVLIVRSAQLLKNQGEFLLQRGEIPVVADDVIGARRLLVLRELPRGPLVDLRVPAGRGARGADPLVRHYHQRSVVQPLQAGLEQQRRLDHERRRRWVARRLLLAPRSNAGHDPRPQQLLQPRPLLGRRERMAGDRGTVDGPARRDLRPPARDDRVAHLGVAVELVHDGVGRQRGGAQPGERRQRLRLAGPDPAREGDERRCGYACSSSAVSGSSAGASASGCAAKTSSDSPSSGTLSRSPAPARSPSIAWTSRRGRIWSSTRLIDSDSRRRSESISRILTRTSSPGWTISRGFSTCCWASSEMCTSPSTPSRISTKAPNATTLVTVPSSSSPTL